MKKCLFFDLDGTLWNALIPLTDSWNDAMEKAGQPFRFTLKMMQSYMGLTPEETCPLSFPGTTLEEGLKLFKIVLDAEIAYLAKHPGTLYPDEREVLGELHKDYELYIISNADKGYVENFINACHMEEYFNGFIQAGDTSLAKWQNILYMKDKVHADDVIYIGDTNKDRTESEKAGVKFIHAAYGFGSIEPDPYKIDSLKELPSLVKKLFGEQ